MRASIRIRLSIMMFLQFFIWGSWYAFIGAYLTELDFSAAAKGSIFSTVALGGIISPFFVGIVADRFFSAQRVLATAHLLGGFFLFLLPKIESPTVFYWTLLAHTVCFMPTLALVNTISFHQMSDTRKQFPGIRVLGTIGWIAAGWFVGPWNLQTEPFIFYLGAAASVVLAVYALFLPNTPPKSAGKTVTVRDILGLDSLVLLKDRSYLIFIISSFLICIPLTFYYFQTAAFLTDLGFNNAGGKMTFGQISEIFFLLLMPFFLVKLGLKRVLLIGMACWVARYILFAFGENVSFAANIRADQVVDALMKVGMIYLAILLHGICFDFFFVSGQIYVDRRAPENIRAQAQGFISFVTYGVGMFVGSYFVGWTEALTKTPAGEIAWRTFWLVPGVMAAAVLIAFALVFNEKNNHNQKPSIST